MKILYSCHGSSLNLFSKINQEFKKDNQISKAAFIVSNKSFYENNFLKNNLSFEKNNLVLKEWELFNKFKPGWNAKKMKASKKFLPNKNWYDKKINLKTNLHFNPNKDFIIIPEIMAHFAVDLNFICNFLFKM